MTRDRYHCIAAGGSFPQRVMLLRLWLMQIGTATGFKRQTFMGSNPIRRTNLLLVALWTGIQ